MATTDKKYTNLEDVLDYGEYKIKVYPCQEWADGAKVPGTHKHGTSDKGFKWWMYATKIGDEYIKVFANEKNKVLFDSGEVTAVVKKKFNPDTGEPIKKIYFNSATGLSQFTQNAIKEIEEKEQCKEHTMANEVFDVPEVKYESPVKITDVPF